MRIFAMFAGAALLCAPLAHADTLTYSLTNVGIADYYGQQIGQLTGTVTVDTDAEKITAINILDESNVVSLSGGSDLLNSVSKSYLTPSGVGASGPYDGYAYFYAYGLNAYFNVKYGQLNGNADGSFSFAPGKIYVYSQNGASGYISGGSLTLPTAVSPTPEPSSFVLLGTGLLGAVGAARRRFLA